MPISPEDLAAIRAHAREVADAAPPLSEDVSAVLRPLLQGQATPAKRTA